MVARAPARIARSQGAAEPGGGAGIDCGAASRIAGIERKSTERIDRWKGGF